MAANGMVGFETALHFAYISCKPGHLHLSSWLRKCVLIFKIMANKGSIEVGARGLTIFDINEEFTVDIQEVKPRQKLTYDGYKLRVWFITNSKQYVVVRESTFIVKLVNRDNIIFINVDRRVYMFIDTLIEKSKKRTILRWLV